MEIISAILLNDASKIVALSLDEAVSLLLSLPKMAKFAMPWDVAYVAAKRAQIGAKGKALALGAQRAELKGSSDFI
jgi:hypothetical protein